MKVGETGQNIDDGLNFEPHGDVEKFEIEAGLRSYFQRNGPWLRKRNDVGLMTGVDFTDAR